MAGWHFHHPVAHGGAHPAHGYEVGLEVYVPPAQAQHLTAAQPQKTGQLHRQLQRQILYLPQKPAQVGGV